MKNSRKNAAYRLILCAAAAAAVCTGASYASCQNETSAPSAQGSAAVQQMKAAKHMPAIRILDAGSDGTTADVRITVKPIASEQAAEDLMITASTGDCSICVLAYDENSKQAVLACSVDCKGAQNIKLFVQSGGVYETVPVTVLADKSVQTDTPLTSATGKKGTLNEIRLNTSTITFQYTLPGYLEAQNEWDADWTEYVHGTPDVTVTFADGSTKKLELQELHGDLEPEVMKTYTHYFGLADAIDLENAETLTVNGTQYTLR